MPSAFDTTPPAVAGVVEAVAPGSAAAAAGILPGDELVAVDGRRLHDVIDWMWLTTDTPVRLTVARDGVERALDLDRAWDQETGVTFTADLFDGVRTCDNACLFCFVSQLPAGLRPSLYVRDDDYRLSFLQGNFVTLTNVTDEDVARIAEQRLSPLYVSLHAVRHDVRETLVCVTVEDRALERIDELLDAGISLHVQVVLVPGVNDGEVLQETLAWLAEHPGIGSVGVVPLGYTRAQARFSRSYGDPETAETVLAGLDLWRDAMSRERGTRWVYGADELYLASGREIPPADDYDGFPQFENGIGMARAFLDEFDASVTEATGGVAPTGRKPVTLVTGELFAPLLADLAPRLDATGVRARVLAVRNRFLGGNVSVAGLLTGRDLVAALRGEPDEGVFLVPDVVVNPDGLLLDDLPAADLAGRSARDVRLVPSDAASLVAETQRIGAQKE